MKPEQTIEGVLYLFSETGTEGGEWAFMDKRHITPVDPLPPGMPDGPSGLLAVYYDESGKVCIRPLLLSELPKESWSHEGRHILGNDDRLTIYDKDEPAHVIWEGVIKLTRYPLQTEHTSDGQWIHTDQDGIPRHVWEKFFLNQHPAKLIRR